MSPTITTAMVPNLKIGDRLKLDFVYLGNTRWLTKVTPLTIGVNMPSGTGNTAEKEEMAFRISGMRALKIDGKPVMGLNVTKARLSWTFVLPSVSNPDAGPGKPDEIADPAMVERIKQFLPGEEISIDYHTVDFMFVIKSLSPVTITETGRVTGIGDKSVINGRLGMQNVACPQVTAVGASGTRFLLIRPDDAASEGLPKPGTGLADMVKGLQKDQTIQYTYYVQAGMRWLVDAQMIDNNQTASTK